MPDSMASLLANYDLLPDDNLLEYSEADRNTHIANVAGTGRVVNFFVENRDALIAASSELEYEIAYMAAHVIQQREYIYRADRFGDTRDSLMAVYSEWWQRILAPDARVAIWAHNFHVMDGDLIDANWMGTFLRDRHFDDYRNVAFSFGMGSFNAFVAGPTGGFEDFVTRQSIVRVPCRTTNQILSEISGDQHYLILDRLESPGREQFTEPRDFLQFGAGFNPTYINNYRRAYELGRLFDVIIHFDETTESLLR